MRLPLLLGAHPRKYLEGAIVPLGAGEWMVTSEHHKDSVIHLCCADDITLLPTPLDGSPVTVKGPRVVYVRIEHPGSELFVNVFAEKQK